jgi:hypothetical protein
MTGNDFAAVPAISNARSFYAGLENPASNRAAICVRLSREERVTNG